MRACVHDDKNVFSVRILRRNVGPLGALGSDSAEDTRVELAASPMLIILIYSPRGLRPQRIGVEGLRGYRNYGCCGFNGAVLKNRRCKVQGLRFAVQFSTFRKAGACFGPVSPAERGHMRSLLLPKSQTRSQLNPPHAVSHRKPPKPRPNAQETNSPKAQGSFLPEC